MNRLLAVRKFLGLTQRQMADILCIRQNAYSMIETGKTSLSSRNRTILAEKLHINPLWLTEGKGEMFRVFSSRSPLPPPASLPDGLSSHCGGIPFYSERPARPTGEPGPGSGRPDYLIDFTPFNDCSFYRSVRGNSMSPQYNPGEIIACKRIDPSGNYIAWGETYLCVIREGESYYETLRVVRPDHERPGNVILQPSGADYETTSVPRDSIAELYLVKGKIVINL